MHLAQNKYLFLLCPYLISLFFHLLPLSSLSRLPLNISWHRYMLAMSPYWSHFLSMSFCFSTRSRTSILFRQLRWVQPPTAVRETPVPRVPRRRPPATRCPCSPRRSVTVSPAQQKHWRMLILVLRYERFPNVILPADLFDFGCYCVSLELQIHLHKLVSAEWFVEATASLLNHVYFSRATCLIAFIFPSLLPHPFWLYNYWYILVLGQL